MSNLTQISDEEKQTHQSLKVEYEMLIRTKETEQKKLLARIIEIKRDIFLFNMFLYAMQEEDLQITIPEALFLYHSLVF